MTKPPSFATASEWASLTCLRQAVIQRGAATGEEVSAAALGSVQVESGDTTGSEGLLEPRLI